LPDTDIKEILNQSKLEFEENQQSETHTVAQKKANEKKIYKDNNLEKILKIAQETF
jgi:hypothetical protein